MRLPIRTAPPLLALAALALMPVLVGSSFALYMTFLFLVYLTLAYSWNIIGGMAGQINLGHAAFFGTGAYITALGVIAGIHPYASVLIGVLGGALLAVSVSPLFRLRGDYFAIGTLGLSEAIKIWLVNIRAYGITFPAYEGLTLVHNYYLLYAIFLLTSLSNYYVLKSKLRLAFNSIRDNESLAEASGINTLKYKVLAMLLSGVTAAAVGGVYGFNLNYVQPEHVYGIEWTLIPLFMVLIGGRGTLLGPVVGSLIYFGAYYALGFTLTEVSLLSFGLVVVVIMKFFPEGLVGRMRYVIPKAIRRQLIH